MKRLEWSVHFFEVQLKALWPRRGPIPTYLGAAECRKEGLRGASSYESSCPSPAPFGMR